MHTQTQMQETEKFAVRQGKWINFHRWRVASTPPIVRQLSVPLKVSPLLTIGFILSFILKMPAKSLRYSAESQLLHATVGIFYIQI